MPQLNKIYSTLKSFRDVIQFSTMFKNNRLHIINGNTHINWLELSIFVFWIISILFIMCWVVHLWTKSEKFSQVVGFSLLAELFILILLIAPIAISNQIVKDRLPKVNRTQLQINYQINSVQNQNQLSQNKNLTNQLIILLEKPTINQNKKLNQQVTNYLDRLNSNRTALENTQTKLKLIKLAYHLKSEKLNHNTNIIANQKHLLKSIKQHQSINNLLTTQN